MVSVSAERARQPMAHQTVLSSSRGSRLYVLYVRLAWELSDAVPSERIGSVRRRDRDKVRALALVVRKGAYMCAFRPPLVKLNCITSALVSTCNMLYIMSPMSIAVYPSQALFQAREGGPIGIDHDFTQYGYQAPGWLPTHCSR